MLASCGGGLAVPDVVEVLVVPAEELEPRDGWSSWGGGSRTIEVAEGLDEVRLRCVLVHELWHQLTLRSDHGGDVGCVSWGASYWPVYAPGYPCACDVAGVRSGVLVVRCEAGIAEDVAFAVSWWNAGLGYEALRMGREVE